ncbi:uncharacterized protein LOC133185628 [Saccostrea echinata]|uniref:uncharacterized protein LOC133185628 n=1 Tax=Saccostrea echinata TaxID=191078 RepID=UPI002A83A39D|nr:uncharacterized protein LOC133185628 [Saccostrea echinata]
MTHEAAAESTTHRPHRSTHAHQTHSHGTHPTHEASVGEFFAFFYDYHTHILLVRSAHTCYLYKTSPQEQIDVHSSHGLHTVEKNVIDIIDSNPTMVSTTHDALVAMNARLGQLCNVKHYTHIYQIN